MFITLILSPSLNSCNKFSELSKNVRIANLSEKRESQTFILKDTLKVETIDFLSYSIYPFKFDLLMPILSLN